MSAEPTLDLLFQRNGRNAKYTVTATMDGEAIYKDVIAPTKLGVGEYISYSFYIR
jgi:hypothetical protein